jgi:calcineurin-like phosphoesterase family protein
MKGCEKMIYYTSDTHFGHNNIIKHCNRPFSSIDEMDEMLIQNWNNIVKQNDAIYIIGDLIFRLKPEKIDVYLQRLNGKKHLIIGNHDRSWINKTPAKHHFFESVNPMLYINDNGRSIIMCHYPMMTWPKQNKGAYMIYGHIHNNINLPFWQLIEENPRMLNAGTDINQFKPATLEELIINNTKFKETMKGNQQ